MQTLSAIITGIAWFGFILINLTVFGGLGAVVWWLTRRLTIAPALALGAVATALLLPQMVQGAYLQMQVKQLENSRIPVYQLDRKPRVVAIVDNRYLNEAKTNRGMVYSPRPPTACSHLCLRLLYEGEVEAVLIGDVPRTSDDVAETTDVLRYSLKRGPCSTTPKDEFDPRPRDDQTPIRGLENIKTLRERFTRSGLCLERTPGNIAQADVVVQWKVTANDHRERPSTGMGRVEVLTMYEREGDSFRPRMRAVYGSAAYRTGPGLINVMNTLGAGDEAHKTFGDYSAVTEMPYLALRPWL